MLELFTVEMQKILSDSQDYLNNILLMIRPLTDAKLTKNQQNRKIDNKARKAAHYRTLKKLK